MPTGTKGWVEDTRPVGCTGPGLLHAYVAAFYSELPWDVAEIHCLTAQELYLTARFRDCAEEDTSRYIQSPAFSNPALGVGKGAFYTDERWSLYTDDYVNPFSWWKTRSFHPPVGELNPGCTTPFRGILASRAPYGSLEKQHNYVSRRFDVCDRVLRQFSNGANGAGQLWYEKGIVNGGICGLFGGKPIAVIVLEKTKYTYSYGGPGTYYKIEER